MTIYHIFGAIFLLGAITDATLSNDCLGYIKKLATFKNEQDLKFHYTFEEDDEHYGQAYVVGFKFSGPLTEIRAYEKHTITKVTDKIWYINRDAGYFKQPIFDLHIRFEHPVEVLHLSINGKTLCSQSTNHEPSTSSDVLTLSFVIGIGAILLSVLVAILILVLKLKSQSEHHWYKLCNLTLNLDRRFREQNNPNAKAVPLPKPPSGKPLPSASLSSVGLSYVALEKACQNPACMKAQGILNEFVRHFSDTFGANEGQNGYFDPSLLEEEGSLITEERLSDEDEKEKEKENEEKYGDNKCKEECKN